MAVSPRPISAYDRAMEDALPDDGVALLYDGECPVCTRYGCSVQIAADAGPIRRIDARGDDPLVRAATAAGYDLDAGMIVVHRGRIHHGAEALRLMAELAPRHGLKHRLNRWFFSSEIRSKIAYPVLRTGRNLLLRLRGRPKIRNLERQGVG